MVIDTKYKIGDTVFGAYVHYINCPETCATCNGSGEVTVTTATESYSVPCPVCGNSIYDTKGPGTLPRYKYSPSVSKLTVGQVRAEVSSVKCKVEYMCEETGVGSGTLHQEDALYPSYDEAYSHAEMNAKLKQIQHVEENAKKEAQNKRQVRSRKKGT